MTTGIASFDFSENFLETFRWSEKQNNFVNKFGLNLKRKVFGKGRVKKYLHICDNLKRTIIFFITYVTFSKKNHLCGHQQYIIRIKLICEM